MNEKLLGIYLQDHLAGATAGLEVAKRTAGSNQGTGYGEALAALRDEIASDREALIALMERLDVGPDRLKNAGAWLGEKTGRLKLNGSLTSYSPLSRMVELEVLTVGITGKLSLWENLRMIAPGEQALAEADLERLIGRAKSQLEVLGRERARAAREAFAD